MFVFFFKAYYDRISYIEQLKIWRTKKALCTHKNPIGIEFRRQKNKRKKKSDYFSFQKKEKKGTKQPRKKMLFGLKVFSCRVEIGGGKKCSEKLKTY